MELMTAAVLDGPGRPLRIDRIPVPAPGPGEVLVRVAACGACHTDLHIIKGEVGFPMPAVLGHEISGTVASLGAGVLGPPPGTRVAASFIMPCGVCPSCAAGRDDLCGPFFEFNRLKGTLYDGTTRLRSGDDSPIWMYSMSGLAEYAVVPATDVFPLPAALPLKAAAIFGCAVFTAYGAVRHAGDIRAGERVAVVAAGGVGLNIVRMARTFGASQVIALDVHPGKLDAARQVGATDTVNAADADAAERVRALTGGDGVDAAFEVLGRPETFTLALDLLRSGGRLVAVGIAAGRTTAPVEMTRLVRRSLRIVGSFGARTRADMPEILRLGAAGVIRPEEMITREFPLSEADAAFRALDEGAIVGRALIVP